MNDKIINPKMYKKTTKAKLNKVKKNKSKNKSKNKNEENGFEKNKTLNFSKKKTKKNNKKIFLKKFLVVIFFVSILIGIVILYKQISSKKALEKANAVPEVYNQKNEKIDLVENYNFRIGISKLDTTDVMKTKNVILNELFLKTKNQLVSVNKDYSINYLIAKKVEKISNKEYIINLNTDMKYQISDVLSSIIEIKRIGASNIYYSYIDNIENTATIENDKIKVILKKDNPYFVYTLKFPITKVGENNENNSTEYLVSSKTDTQVDFTKSKAKSTVGAIKFSNYEDSSNMVNDFKENKIDMFFASSDSNMQLIGKYEHNTKKYRDGETTFVLGNKDSLFFSKKEIRQAIAYAINRDEIVKKTNNSNFFEVIDLPYIYSNVNYKYDTYAATNALVSNGWNKSSGIYSKKIDNQNKKMELNLLVNADDSSKLKIADMIKQMLEQFGIKTNIVSLKEKQLNERINSGQYDIVLANLYINDYPDITYLEKHLNLNDITNKAFEQFKQGDSESTFSNLQNLQNVLSSEVACIGVMARTTNVIYQKDITGFDDIGYMKIFDFEKIGKLANLDVKN